MNLALGERDISGDPDEPRIFSSSVLNKSIILKHTMRPHEREIFRNPRKVGTKIIFPYDFRDLRLGGASIFINQVEFERNPNQFIKITGANSNDVEILGLLDGLPSLDPFLVKEHANRLQLHIPVERLALSPADIFQMHAFVRMEVKRLIVAALPEYSSDISDKFAKKILTDTRDESMDPLMHALKMSETVFWDGIFSWRGFLYYKWRLQNMDEAIDELFSALKFYGGARVKDKNIAQYIYTAQPKIVKKLELALGAVNRMIGIYDDAYDAMLRFSDPGKFKTFLLNGPALFVSLGEQVGLIDHFTSLWRFRHRSGSGAMSMFEYADFLVDIDQSISIAIGSPNDG